jgi:hypothetical protein
MGRTYYRSKHNHVPILCGLVAKDGQFALNNREAGGPYLLAST